MLLALHASNVAQKEENRETYPSSCSMIPVYRRKGQKIFRT